SKGGPPREKSLAASATRKKTPAAVISTAPVRVFMIGLLCLYPRPLMYLRRAESTRKARTASAWRRFGKDDLTAPSAGSRGRTTFVAFRPCAWERACHFFAWPRAASAAALRRDRSRA